MFIRMLTELRSAFNIKESNNAKIKLYLRNRTYCSLKKHTVTRTGYGDTSKGLTNVICN